MQAKSEQRKKQIPNHWLISTCTSQKLKVT